MFLHSKEYKRFMKIFEADIKKMYLGFLSYEYNIDLLLLLKILRSFPTS